MHRVLPYLTLRFEVVWGSLQKMFKHKTKSKLVLYIFQKDFQSGGMSVSPAFHIVKCLRQFLCVPCQLRTWDSNLHFAITVCWRGDHHTDAFGFIMVDHLSLRQKEPLTHIYHILQPKKHIVSFDVLYDVCIASPQTPSLQTVHIESVIISILGWGNLGCVPTWCTKQHVKWKHQAVCGSFVGLWWADISPQTIW